MIFYQVAHLNRQIVDDWFRNKNEAIAFAKEGCAWRVLEHDLGDELNERVLSIAAGCPFAGMFAKVVWERKRKLSAEDEMAILMEEF